ncbi:MAG: flagellar hook-basal body protein, partial [Candidatus Desulfacyla sp.]
MSQALFSVASGAKYHEERLDVLANNLSNINTTGYKKDKLIFRIPKEEGERLEKPGVMSSLYSSPPVPSGITIDFSQGDLKQTDHPLDLALSGDGFFCIDAPDGTRYTRKGIFDLDQDGTLVTKEGHPVLVTKEGTPIQGGGESIKISGQDVRVDENGKVHVDGERVGAIKVVRIIDLHNLRKVGDTMFA